MNLISCEECGAVYDTDRLEEFEADFDEDGEIDNPHQVHWNNEDMEYASFFTCPACKSFIYRKNGDLTY